MDFFLRGKSWRRPTIQHPGSTKVSRRTTETKKEFAMYKFASSLLLLSLLIVPGAAFAENEGGTGDSVQARPAATPPTDSTTVRWSLAEWVRAFFGSVELVGEQGTGGSTEEDDGSGSGGNDGGTGGGGGTTTGAGNGTGID
jgi:uncharacterized membrane protein YgcG